MPQNKNVIVNVNLEIKTPELDEDEARAYAENYELPGEYVEDSFEIVKVVDDDYNTEFCPHCEIELKPKMHDVDGTNLQEADTCPKCGYGTPALL